MQEHRGYITINVPIELIERLDPFAIRRTKSRFVAEAIRVALDKYDAEQAAQKPEPATAAS